MDERHEMPGLAVVRHHKTARVAAPRIRSSRTAKTVPALPACLRSSPTATAIACRQATGQIGSVSAERDSGCRCISAVRQMLLFEQFIAEQV